MGLSTNGLPPLTLGTNVSYFCRLSWHLSISFPPSPLFVLSLSLRSHLLSLLSSHFLLSSLFCSFFFLYYVFVSIVISVSPLFHLFSYCICASVCIYASMYLSPLISPPCACHSTFQSLHTPIPLTSSLFTLFFSCCFLSVSSVSFCCCVCLHQFCSPLCVSSSLIVVPSAFRFLDPHSVVYPLYSAVLPS